MKFTIAFVAILTGICSCASGDKAKKLATKDILGRPIGFLLKDNKEIYYSENEEKMIAYFGGVEFNGGKDSLSAYLLSKYINHPDYNYDEYNVYEYFIVLFDKNLDVKEVRIMHTKFSSDKRPYYDSIFIDALKNTTGLWHKTVDDQEWYTYLHKQKIY